jgi:hypothetical protein
MLTRSLFPAGSLAPAAVVQRQQEIVAALDLNKCQASTKVPNQLLKEDSKANVPTAG